MRARNPFEAREVTSRRGGPVKAPLSRQAIVTEALRQLRRDGLAGMSLRKVATALKTGPASLYAYVDDLQELQALVLDRALGSVDARGAKRGAWRANLERLLASYLEVLFASPGLAQLALSTIAVGPNALAHHREVPGTSGRSRRRSPDGRLGRRPVPALRHGDRRGAWRQGGEARPGQPPGRRRARGSRGLGGRVPAHPRGARRDPRRRWRTACDLGDRRIAEGHSVVFGRNAETETGPSSVSRSGRRDLF